MVLDFRGCDYVCKYYDGNYLKSGLCFSKGFGVGTNNGYAHITCFIPIKPDELNYVFVTEQQMLDYFIELSELFSFNIITFHKTETHYKLQLRIPCERDYSRYVLYVLTFIRYAYEHPFSIALKCALENRQYFKGLSIVEIIQFYLGVFCNKRTCHHHGNQGRVFKNMNVKSQFNNIVNQFNYSVTFTEITTEYVKTLDYIQLFNIKCLDQLCYCINLLAIEIYEKYKKDICRW